MNKTKIDWADMTWNPVTGCLNGCEYCYARKITERFKSKINFTVVDIEGQCFIKPLHLSKEAYPWGFYPTYHPDRLGEPAKIKKPQNIFVCSMADLFGDWVPDAWIEEVFNACEAAPRHRYLFLTKNTKRYTQDPIWNLANSKPNWWFGTTATTQKEVEAKLGKLPLYRNGFLSIEPIFEDLSLKCKSCTLAQSSVKWVIIGAETGNRKGKVIPKREWIEAIVEQCREAGVPVFMKDSLRGIMGEDFIQEWPDGWRKEAGQ